MKARSCLAAAVCLAWALAAHASKGQSSKAPSTKGQSAHFACRGSFDCDPPQECLAERSSPPAPTKHCYLLLKAGAGDACSVDRPCIGRATCIYVPSAGQKVCRYLANQQCSADQQCVTNSCNAQHRCDGGAPKPKPRRR